MLVSEQEAQAVSRLWGVNLVVGILYLILGFIVLSFDTTSLTVVSILIGVSFIFTGLAWFFLAAVVPELRWFWVIGGVLAIVAGVIAIAYPDETLRILSLIVGWFLLIAGILDVVLALTNRDREYWWMTLIAGAVMFGLGAWAVREPNRSIVLLLAIVGVYCIIRGVSEIVQALQLRKLGDQPKQA